MIDCILLAIAVDAGPAQEISVHETLIVGARGVGTKMAFALHVNRFGGAAQWAEHRGPALRPPEARRAMCTTVAMNVYVDTLRFGGLPIHETVRLLVPSQTTETVISRHAKNLFAVLTSMRLIQRSY
jgi:hypothetical protein